MFPQKSTKMAKDRERKVLYFCDGKKCCRYNKEAKDCLESLLNDLNVKNPCALEKMKCQGMCKKAPVFYIESHKKYKKEVDQKKAKKIFDKYLASY